MKIYPIQSPINYNFSRHGETNKQNINTRNAIRAQYDPPYYKPLNFKGTNDFQTYFPVKILDISEKQFDSLILNALKNNSQKNTIIKYIISKTAKDNQTLSFINIWKKQVPSMISQGVFMSMTDNVSNLLRSALSLGSKNIVNSDYKKFSLSDHQYEILAKDGKSTMAGLTSFCLFNMANMTPEPMSKAAFYLAAITVGMVGFNERNKDSQNIYNNQFLDATKELLKTGVLDPYELISCLDEQKGNLGENEKIEYAQWQNERKKELLYQKTARTIDYKNDFDEEKARNVLNVLIETLKNYFNFDDEKIGIFLEFLALQYESTSNYMEAEYLARMAFKVFQTIQNEDRQIEAYRHIASLCVQNEKFNEALLMYKNLEAYYDQNDNEILSDIDICDDFDYED